MPPSRCPRVTFDSNVWEKVFDPDDGCYAPIRNAVTSGAIEGYICEAGFRIEAIMKRQRPTYFAQPHMDVTVDIRPLGNGQFELLISMGPDDGKHPGLPEVQVRKFRSALDAGVRVIRGQAWLGLPGPQELSDPALFLPETEDEVRERVGRQSNAAYLIGQRGVGQGAFETVGGWEVRDRTPAEEKLLAKACAEWADGELIAAHIGYQNDIFCTEDRAQNAGKSVFDEENRRWLSETFGVAFCRLDALLHECSP